MYLAVGYLAKIGLEEAAGPNGRPSLLRGSPSSTDVLRPAFEGSTKNISR
jgi:hypothetical protein